MASRKKKIGLGCAGVVVLALLVFVVSARRFIFPPHFDVVSIASGSTYQDGALLERAWALPVGHAYKDAGVVFQPNGSFCGPTSLANVLHSLDEKDVTPRSVLEGTGKCRLGFCVGGLTLDELAGVARHGARHDVTVLRDLSKEEFRAHLLKTNDSSRRYIVNFDRGPLFSKAGGHHSPIAGYLADVDLVLVIDVNAKYQPWLVAADRLYEAMDTVDPASEKKRGLLLIE